MTIDEFTRIVLKLANLFHVRYWLNWGYPNEPQILVLQILADIERDEPRLAEELRQLGLRTFQTSNGDKYWMAERSD